MSIESMSDLVSIIKAKGKNLEEFAMIAWLIWIQRKKLRINEAALPSTMLAQSVLALLVEFQQGKQRQEPKNRVGLVRWQSLLEDTVKDNFDGAVFREDQETGIRVVICNNEGQMLAALSEKVIMPTIVEILEMLAARRATVFARELRFHKVFFEGDVELVVKSLQTRTDSNVLASHLVKDFMSIRGYFQSYSIIHVRRQGNHVSML